MTEKYVRVSQSAATEIIMSGLTAYEHRTRGKGATYGREGFAMDELRPESKIAVARWAAATHEAGHALVGIVLGRKVTGAILRPPYGTSGETQFEDEGERELDLSKVDDRRYLEDHLVMLLAGQVADAPVWERAREYWQPEVDTQRDDDAEIDRWAAVFEFSPEREADFRSHCRRRAEELVLNPNAQAAIQEIAAVLSGQRRIGRVLLDNILRNHRVTEAAGDEEEPGDAD